MCRLGICAALVFVVACGDDGTEPAQDVETTTTEQATMTVVLPANDRLRAWGVEQILVEATRSVATAQLVTALGQPLATMDLRFDDERLFSAAQIYGLHGPISLALLGGEGEQFSMRITAGEQSWSATKDKLDGDSKLYDRVSKLGYIQAFSDIVVAVGPSSGGRPRGDALWGAHLAQGCWEFPNGAGWGCAAGLPALALDLATINWTWGLCTPLCYGAGLAPPSAVGCFACIGMNIAIVGLSIQMWNQIYPEQCRRACLNGCFGDYPPMPDYTCGRAGLHEAPPPGMACVDGLVKCCGTYCEYPTLCTAQSASQGAPAALGQSCGTMNVVKEGVAYPTCNVVPCAQGWCDDPDRDGIGTCVDTMPQPPSSTYKTDPAQPTLATDSGSGAPGSMVTVNCSNPTAFMDQCRATSLRNVKTTYSRCWLCGYWTCGELWDANKDVPEKAWCDMLASNCSAATVQTCSTAGICGGMGQSCCNTGGGNKCTTNLSCTDINGQQKCDE
jgi:hypothetical protein